MFGSGLCVRRFWSLRRCLLRNTMSVMFLRSGTPLGSGAAPTARVRLGRPCEVYNNVVTPTEKLSSSRDFVQPWRKPFGICKPPEVADGDVHHLYEPAVTTATRCSTTMSSEDAPSAAVATDHRPGRPSTLLWTIWRNTFLTFLIIALCCLLPFTLFYPAPQTPSTNALVYSILTLKPAAPPSLRHRLDQSISAIYKAECDSKAANAVVRQLRPRSRDPVVPGGDVLLLSITCRNSCIRKLMFNPLACCALQLPE